MPGSRTYDDPCGIARALDVVGERLALLVVRELILGPQRFAALHRALHGASQNVLSQRLRELEASGVVTRVKLAPPAGVWVYELTAAGRALEPVVLELGRWGSRQPVTTDSELSPDSLMLALKTTLEPGSATVAEFHLGEAVFGATVTETFDVSRGPVADPALIVRSDVPTVRELAFGSLTVTKALAGERLTLDGPVPAAAALFARFRRPELFAPA